MKDLNYMSEEKPIAKRNWYPNHEQITVYNNEKAEIMYKKKLKRNNLMPKCIKNLNIGDKVKVYYENGLAAYGQVIGKEGWKLILGSRHEYADIPITSDELNGVSEKHCKLLTKAQEREYIYTV